MAEQSILTTFLTMAKKNAMKNATENWSTACEI
jgi:spore coat protein CotF